MAFVPSQGLPVGTPAPPFDLPATDGKSYRLNDFDSAKALLVVITCNHCPVARAVEDRLVRIQADFGPRGLQLVAINPNDAAGYPEDSFEAMVRRAEEKGFNFPYLRDESQEVAQAYGATCTPDPFLFDSERRLVYNGRIDDNWKNESEAEHHDLRSMIESLLSDSSSAPLPEVHPSVGCSIKWKR